MFNALSSSTEKQTCLMPLSTIISKLTLEGDSGKEVALWRLTLLSRWSKAKFHTEITKGNGISQSSLLYVIFILKFIMVIPILLSDWLEFQISPSQKPYTW
jgi:hypothetical protein